MARQRGTPKPQARNRRPCRPENRENLISFALEVLCLRLKALNLPIPGARCNWLNAFQPTQRSLAKARKTGWSCLKGQGQGQTVCSRACCCTA